VLDCFIYVLTY